MPSVADRTGVPTAATCRRRGQTDMSNGNTACFLNINGTVHAILNWRTRRSKEDVIIGCKLDEHQKGEYERLTARGYDETAICDKLFPMAAVADSRHTVDVDIELLTKSQLVRLIRERLQEPLPSLDKLNTHDLRAILAACAG